MSVILQGYCPLEHVVNMATIAERQGLSRPAVANHISRCEDFPKPLDMPGVIGIPLYDGRAVEAWYQGRLSQRSTALRAQREALAARITKIDAELSATE